MSRDKIKSKFLRSVSKNIRCRNQDKKPYLEFLSKQVDDFLEENEAADYVQLCETLGEPEKIAEEYLVNLSNDEIRDLSRKAGIRKIVLVTAVIIVMIISLSMIFTLVDAHKSYYGYGKFSETKTSSMSINSSYITNGDGVI